MHRLTAITLVVLLLSVLRLSAQTTDTARVAPIVVTATRMPVGQGALPVAVTVITGDELRLRGITTVADALGEVTSAHVAQSGSPGATTSLFLRGGESKYVKVLVDGVPANDPGGAYDFASLTTDNIDRIEIVRGPASVIHGADAVTGVVHVITRRGTGAARTDGELRVGSAPRANTSAARDPGSLQTLYGSASMHGSLQTASYSLSLARHQSSGLYDVNNEYRNNVLSGRVLLRPSERTDVSLSLRYTDYRFHYPTDGGGTPRDTNAFREEDRTVIGLEVEHELRPSLRAVVSLGSSVNDGGTDDAVDGPGGSSFVSQDKTRRRNAEVRFQLHPLTSTAVTIGAQVEQQDQRSQFQSESPFGPFASRFSAARRNQGAYVETMFTPTPRISATAGIRVDDNQQFGTFGTGRVGLSWRPGASTRLRATAGNAFREPSFFENFATGFVTGNPALRPERTLSVDAGVEQEMLAGRARVSVTGFAQRFRDMIDYTGSAASCGFSYCNVAEATSNGVELEASARLAGPLWASAGATLLTTEVIDPGFDSSSAGLYRRGESLIRRPAQRWTADLSYRGPNRLSMSARVLGVGQRPDRDFTGFPATPVTLPAYQRIDIAGEYRLHGSPARRAAATFRIENATNAEYQNVYNFLAPRRTITLGVRFQF